MDTWVTPHEERINNIHLQVTVPGTEFQAELRNRDQITVSFGRGRYPFLGERDLEHYLAALGRLLYAAWLRAYAATLDDVLRDNRGPHSQADRDYQAARAEIAARGASTDERLVITTRGLRDGQVRIAPGTLRALSEREFLARISEASAALIHDHLTQVSELKRRYYP